MWSGLYSRAQGSLRRSGRKKSSGHHWCASISFDKFLFHTISVLYTVVTNTLHLVLSPFPMKSWAKLCPCVTFVITVLDMSGPRHHHGFESPGTPLITSGTGVTATCFKWGHTSVSSGLFNALIKARAWSTSHMLVALAQKDLNGWTRNSPLAFGQNSPQEVFI